MTHRRLLIAAFTFRRQLNSSVLQRHRLLPACRQADRQLPHLLTQRFPLSYARL